MGFEIRSLGQPAKDTTVFMDSKNGLWSNRRRILPYSRDSKKRSMEQQALAPPVFMGFNIRSMKQLVMDNGTPILRIENTAFFTVL
jgi:hypothetical protein